jgi:ABC-type branched-subunit amino acid transport system substrate-binding protein
MKLSTLTAALAGAVLALTACGGSPAPSAGSGKTIKIGLAISETGTSATSATGAKNAMGFAVKQINDKGGIDGAKIEFVTRDIGSTAATAVAGAQQFAQDNVVAVIGMSLTVQYLAVLPIFQKAKIISLLGTASDVDDRAHTNNPYGFVFNVPDSVTAQHQVGFATKTLHASKIALLLDSTAFGSNYGKLVTPVIEAAGASVVTSQSVNPDANDLSTQVSKILATKPDLIMMAILTSQTGLLAYKELEKQAGSSKPALMVAAAIVATLGLGIPWASAQGTYGTFMTHGMYDPSARSKADADFFTAVGKNNTSPVSDTNAEMHDAIIGLAAAIQGAGGVDPDKVVAKLAALKGFSSWNGIKTVTGPYTCAATQECLFNQYLGQVKGNALVEVQRYTT